MRETWRGHAVRVEASDGEVPVGTPDCVLSYRGAGGWIELKVWPDNVSPEQKAWHVDAIERGAYAMVLSELPSGKVWLGPAEEYHGIVNLFEYRNFQRRQLFACSSGKVPEGISLQNALGVIESALSRKSSR